MAEEHPPQRSQPSGNSAWSALSTLISGGVAWGGLGALIDWWLDVPKHLGLLTGMLVGMVTAVYLVIKRFG